MKKICFVIIMGLAFGIVQIQKSVFAAESGTGHYIPGALADIGDMPPPSGFALLNWYNRYDGSVGGARTISFDRTTDGRIVPIVSREIIFGGTITSNVNATSNIEMLGGFYTLPCGILGAKYSVGIIVPYMWMDVKGTINLDRNLNLERVILDKFAKDFSFSRSRTFTANDSANGISDMILIPFWLSWNKGDFKWGTQLNIYAPTGEYNTGQLANVGLNYWTFEPMVSFSYLSKKIGLEITTTAGFDFNTTNNDIDYHSGDVFHVDATIAEHLPLFGYGIIGLGANAFYWKQFNADSGSGARLGSFETLMAGVGPVLSYVSPPFCGGHLITAEFKWLPQIDTDKTLKGDYIWFKAAVTF
jgi:hypothetical protein